jgi:hypothetical protein
MLKGSNNPRMTQQHACPSGLLARFPSKVLGSIPVLHIFLKIFFTCLLAFQSKKGNRTP